MHSCRDISKLLSRSLDESLSKKEHFRVKVHLLICRLCRRYWKELKTIQLCIKKYYSNVVENNKVELSDESKEKIKKAICEDLN